MGLHQPGQREPLCLADSLRLHPTQLVGRPKPLPVAFPCKQPVLAHVVVFPKSSQRVTNPKLAQLASVSSQLSFSQAPSRPAQVAAVCGALRSSHQVAPSRALAAAATSGSPELPEEALWIAGFSIMVTLALTGAALKGRSR